MTMTNTIYASALCTEIHMNNLALLRCSCPTSTIPTYQRHDKCGLKVIRAKCSSPKCIYQSRGWYICTLCIGISPCFQVHKMLCLSQVRKHAVTHKNDINEDSNILQKYDIGNDPFLCSAVNDDHMDTIKSTNNCAIDENKIDEKFYNYLEDKEAMKYLVAKQFIDSENPSAIDNEDAEIHILITFITYQLGPKNNKRLARLFDLLERKHGKELKSIGEERDFYEKELTKMKRESTHVPTTKINNVSIVVNDNIPCPLPRESYQLRRYIDGSRSILQGLPSPKVRNLANGSAYTLLSDAIRCYLPFGMNLNYAPEAMVDNHSFEAKKQVAGYWDCKKAREALTKIHPIINGKKEQEYSSENSAKKKKIITISEWSDGCDPNGTNKNNRGSFHIITFSILGDENKNNEDNTFLLAVSRDKTDHEPVRRLIYEDIRSLEKGAMFFDGKDEFEIQVIFLVSIQDRPERSESTGFGSHNGTCTLRWGYVCPIADCLPSCEDCQKNRMNNKTLVNTNDTCKICSDWEFDDVIFNPENYPTEMLDGEKGDGFLRSRKVTYDSMRTAAQMCTQNVRSGTWSTKQGKSYLKHNGWNGKMEKEILRNAQNNNTQLVDNILPAKFSAIGGIDMQMDAIMHMLFLGVTKTVGGIMKRTFKKFGKYTRFHNDISAVLVKTRQCSLHWMKAWSFGSMKTPFGPYVSENCLAYCRMLKCIYSYSDVIDDKKSDDRNQILRKAQLMYSSWIAVVLRVMQPTVTDEHVHDTDRHIRIFLTAFNDLDKELLECVLEENDDGIKENVGARKKTTIETTANLSSLLNIPNAMQTYGPPRLYWEGSLKGEGILRIVKLIVTQGTHSPWFAASAMKRFYKEKTIGMLLRKESGVDLSVIKTESETGYGEYKTYKTIDLLKNILIDGRGPVSGVHDDEGFFWCAIVHGNKRMFINMIVNDTEGFEYNKTWYASVGVGDRMVTKKEIGNIANNIVFLPTLSTKQKIPVYYIVNEDWKERQRVNISDKFEFELPKVQGVSY